MANGYRTLSQHLNDLKKENFSLKLRIYFLEERVQQKGEGSRDDVYRRVSTHGGQGWVPNGAFPPNALSLLGGDGARGLELVRMPRRASGTPLGLGELLRGSLPLAAFDRSGERVGEGVPSPVGCPGWVAVPVWVQTDVAGTPHSSSSGLKYHPCHSVPGAPEALPWGGPCHL